MDGLEMTNEWRGDVFRIVGEALDAVRPDQAVRRALAGYQRPEGRLILIAAGKAAWSMANAAHSCLGDQVDQAFVISKQGHSQGEIADWNIFEGGHPVPDEAGIYATETVLSATETLNGMDGVVLLLSGGASALFESPLVSLEELQSITRQLLACGADIVEINTIRKRLSAVKGGRFAKHCAPAKVFTVVLSDVIGDPLDMIASGPAYPDSSTSADALAIVEKYGLSISAHARRLLEREAVKELDNVESCVTGSVRELCIAAANSCRTLGYEPVILTDCLTCQAREAGAFLAAIAKSHADCEKATAFIVGGETVVHLLGDGKGGRNQELALAAAEGIAGFENIVVFSVGSDGTDGPTDAAGGVVTGATKEILARKHINIYHTLQENDAYCALKACDGLIVTGATGTNVNDISIALLRPKDKTNNDGGI